MATIIIPDNIIDNEFMHTFLEAFREGKFLPSSWVNNLPKGNLENIKFIKDHNLIKAICYMSYSNYAEAVVACAFIQEWIAYSDKSIPFSEVKQERTLVYFTYNFIKL